jgi:hypothetical protein
LPIMKMEGRYFPFRRIRDFGLPGRLHPRIFAVLSSAPRRRSLAAHGRFASQPVAWLERNLGKRSFLPHNGRSSLIIVVLARSRSRLAASGRSAYRAGLRTRRLKFKGISSFRPGRVFSRIHTEKVGQCVVLSALRRDFARPIRELHWMKFMRSAVITPSRSSL